MARKSKKSTSAQMVGWDSIAEMIKAQGIDLEELCDMDALGAQCKVICLDPNLGESVQEMGLLPRDVTLMVRTDDKTSQALDAWRETGYFKSRSEAAALFLREGLKVRGSELEKLKDDLQEVEKAKTVLHAKARKILEGK